MATNVNLEGISGEIEKSFLADEESTNQGNKVINWLKKKRIQLKPWGKFVNTRAFSAPKDLNDAAKRIVKNVDTYQANYIIICLFLSLYCIISSPMLLFAISLASGACYFIARRNGQKLMISGREFSVAEQYALVITISLPLFFFASAGSAVFWIIGASVFIITLHASLTGISVEEHEVELDEITAVS